MKKNMIIIFFALTLIGFSKEKEELQKVEGFGEFNTSWSGFGRTRDARQANFDKEKPMQTGAIVFMGDSITQEFNVTKDFPEYLVANRGISGDTTRGFLTRFQDNVLDLKPQAIVIMGGRNDLGQERGKPEHIVENILLMVKKTLKCRQKPLPKIFVCEMLPFSTDEKNDVKLVNNRLAKELPKNKNIKLVKINNFFSLSNGKCNIALFRDGTHLKLENYKIWRDLLNAEFEQSKLIKKKSKGVANKAQ